MTEAPTTGALVVYESMFGNTQKVAEAIAGGLARTLPTDLIEVGAAETAIADGLRLLVVGGPTHAFGLTRPATREDAARQASGHVVSGRRGIREWLGLLRRGSSRTAVATFDTRIDKPRVPGSAARAAEKRLRRLGFPIAARAESFYVSGTPGPLVTGELDRARAWGERLGAELLARTR